MSLFEFKSFLFFGAVLCLFVGVQGVDWQGYGNMSSSNLTTIWGYITPTIGQVVQDAKNAISDINNPNWNLHNTLYVNFSTNFSNFLNELWHPAWNVFTIPTIAGKDAILYGYAFRDHWMWYNGYVSGGQYVTFIIWKDYNCQVWTNIGIQNTGTLDQASINSAVTAVNIGNPRTDIWGTTKRFMNSLVSKPIFSGDDRAFTIIASEDVLNTVILGRVCLAGENKYFKPTRLQILYSPNPYWGNYYIFQMR